MLRSLNYNIVTCWLTSNLKYGIEDCLTATVEHRCIVTLNLFVILFVKEGNFEKE